MPAISIVIPIHNSEEYILRFANSLQRQSINDFEAIAWALRSPERFSVEAVYAAPFSGACFSALYAGAPAACAPAVPAGSPGEGMRKSYDEILRVFSLLGESAAGRVFYGAGRYLGPGGEPADSDAGRDLIARARASRATSS